MCLPDKPSAMIRIALSDLEKCEKDPTLRINMDSWMKPRDKVCHVCLAGSVMYQSLGFRPIHNQYENPPSAFVGNTDTERKLLALNEFRLGRVELAYIELGRKLPKQIRGVFEVAFYDDDPTLFKDDMRALATLLEVYGE